MPQLDPASLSVLATASLALTQILKDLGLQGDWLKVACIVVSSVLGYIMLFQPALWSALILPLVGTTTTGGVSFVHELIQKMKAGPTE